MRASEICVQEVRTGGVVHRIDTVNREMTVYAGDVILVIDVPPDCPITLRGELVKLRMLQSRDRIWVTYAEHRDLRVASVVEVQPE